MVLFLEYLVSFEAFFGTEQHVDMFFGILVFDPK